MVMTKLIGYILKFKWIILVIVFGLTLFFAYQIKFIEINSDIFSSLPDDDPTATLYKEIGDQFNGNEIGMIVLETASVFDPVVLEHIRTLTDSLLLTEGISTVISMTNIMDIKSSEWGIEIGKLVDEYNLPKSAESLDSLRDYVYSKEMYRGNIVSNDGTATLVLFTMYPDADKQKLASSVREMVLSMGLPEQLYFGGLLFMLDDISSLILSDMIWLIPIVFLLIAFILFLSFRSFRGMIMPLMTAGITVIWTLGIMAIFGFELSIISNIMPVVLLAIGSAYTIHILNSIHIYNEQSNNRPLPMAMQQTTVPVILAALTTAIGFIAFIFGAYLKMIKEFGINTAIGILIALLLSIVFVPALLEAFNGSKQRPSRPERSAPDLIKKIILVPMVTLLKKRKKLIMVSWILIIVLSIGGIFQLKTSINITSYFKKDNPTRVSENIMQEKFGGSMPVYLLFEGDVQDPALLKMMQATADFIEEDPNIESTQSVADLIIQLNDAMGEGEKIPDEREKVEQLWFLLEGQEIMPQLVSEDLSQALLQTKFASIETSQIEAFTKKLNEFTATQQAEHIKISFTGIPPLYVQLNKSLIKSQYSSLIIAILLVLVIVGSIMRSFAKGLYATIPIIATILILIGFMGFTGIPLDIATVLVGSIALGIGIDYSIHLITGFNYFMKKDGDPVVAMEQTILTKGRAIIINIISVAAGFLVLLFAHILPVQNFGLLIAISMVGSGLGALTLLPLILLYAYRKKEIIPINKLDP
jgi:hydrophobe/amphiphile efflux-3 (HAE3) family protein